MAFSALKDGTIVVGGFEQGIAPSPHKGIANIQCANLSTETGEVLCNFTRTMQTAASFPSSTFTANSSSTLIGPAGLLQGMWIHITSSSITNLTTNTDYYIKTVSVTTITISASYEGSQVSSLGVTGVASFTSYDMATPVAMCFDQTQTSSNGAAAYVLDSSYRIWRNPPGVTHGLTTTWTLLSPTGSTGANGIFFFGSYLFIVGYASSGTPKIGYFATDTVGHLGTAVTDFKTINTAGPVPHFALVGHDSTGYWCDGSSVGSLIAIGTFDPTSSGTYTFAENALALPTTEVATTLAELGTSLVVGAISNNLYPWDRVSTSFTYPILLPENYTASMVTANNMLYVFCGSKGNIYITNGSTASLVITIPDYVTGQVEPYYIWGGVMYLRGRIWFSAKDSNNAAGGVWSFIPTQNLYIGQDTGLSLRLENQNSYGNYQGYAALLFASPVATAQQAQGPQYYSAWNSNGTGTAPNGIDFSGATPYTSGQTLIESDIVPVGAYSDPQNYAGIEFRLSAPLVSGESIQILVRQNLISSYVSCGTFNAVGGVSFRFPLPSRNFYWVQIKAVLISTSSSPSFVRLKELRIYKVT